MSVTPKKLTPKQIHTQERKKLVYMTAVNLFLTQGYDSTTIKDISTESGVSVGSIYHFYENKAAILMAYANRVLQNEALKYLEITDESLADPTRFILDYYCTMSSTFQKLGTDMTRHVQGTLNRRWFNPNGTINEDYVHTDLIRFEHNPR